MAPRTALTMITRISDAFVVVTSQSWRTSWRVERWNAMSRIATATAAMVFDAMLRCLGGCSCVLTISDDTAHAPRRRPLRQRRPDPEHRARLDPGRDHAVRAARPGGHAGGQ